VFYVFYVVNLKAVWLLQYLKKKLPNEQKKGCLAAALLNIYKPIDFKNASWFGSRPKKFFTNSYSSSVEPFAKISSR